MSNDVPMRKTKSVSEYTSTRVSLIPAIATKGAERGGRLF